jgi:hypothetical protein
MILSYSLDIRQVPPFILILCFHISVLSFMIFSALVGNPDSGTEFI